MADMFKAAIKQEFVMSGFKDYLTATAIALSLLLGSAMDDSYEDSKLSAQVLEEAIAQANEEQERDVPETEVNKLVAVR
jgi:hypothetical protein